MAALGTRRPPDAGIGVAIVSDSDEAGEGEDMKKRMRWFVLERETGLMDGFYAVQDMCAQAADHWHDFRPTYTHVVCATADVWMMPESKLLLNLRPGF